MTWPRVSKEFSENARLQAVSHSKWICATSPNRSQGRRIFGSGKHYWAVRL
jgi:hypothetical protein